MNKTLLHLSHTDIRYDSRILKELHALDGFLGFSGIGIGFEFDEGSSASRQPADFNIVTITLYSRVFRFFPRVLRYALNFIELTFVLFFRGVLIRPAVVHCHDTLVLPAGWLIKLAVGCRLVYDAHELESNKNGQTAMLSKATFWIEQTCWKKVDLLVSVSDSIIQWYRDNLGEKDTILVLNSPELGCVVMADSGDMVEDDYFHRLYDIPRERLVFVYLGILGPGRGIETVLDVFGDDSLNFDVVFVGYGEFGGRIASCADRHKNIHLHPPVAHEQVVRTVRSADYGLCFVENVSLSDYYCLPNKLFEYAFAGLPVFASNFPEIERAVSRYSLGICCAPDRESVRSAICATNGRRPERVRGDLSDLAWTTQANRLRDAYKALLEKMVVSE